MLGDNRWDEWEALGELFIYLLLFTQAGKIHSTKLHANVNTIHDTDINSEAFCLNLIIGNNNRKTTGDAPGYFTHHHHHHHHHHHVSRSCRCWKMASTTHAMHFDLEPLSSVDCYQFPQCCLSISVWVFLLRVFLLRVLPPPPNAPNDLVTAIKPIYWGCNRQ